jgi:hypothetical protein
MPWATAPTPSSATSRPESKVTMVTRKGQAWTPEDDADLRYLLADNAGISRLRDALGRSGGAIGARLGKPGSRRTDMCRPESSNQQEKDNV